MGSIVKKYVWILNLIAVAAVSYFLARMTTLLIAGYFPDVVIPPKPPRIATTEMTGKSQSEVDIDAIIKRNFFDSQESVFQHDAVIKPVVADNGDKADNQNKAPKNLSAVLTTLNIQLISTVAVGDGRDRLSSCVIQSGRAPDVYTVGGKKSFAPNTSITRILPRRVEFLNDGTLEYVELQDYAKGMNPRAQPEKNPLQSKRVQTVETPEDNGAGAGSGSIEREGNNFTIPRVEVDKALANLAKIYTDIRAVPYFKNGKADGFKLINVKPGSLFEKLGLRRGDILRSINGTTLDIQSGLQTFNTLKNESSFTLEIERRGVEQSFSYQII